MFTVSEVRDLFFHVQEHRFTCLMLQEAFRDLELDLMLFAPDAHQIRQAYKNRYPDDPNAVNLKYWHEFEQQYPNLFLGMYKFYCGHKGLHKIGGIPDWLS
ncbi:MAG: hypothetical protein AAF244_04185 [Pseudomonadota bacterium]